MFKIMIVNGELLFRNNEISFTPTPTPFSELYTIIEQLSISPEIIDAADTIDIGGSQHLLINNNGPNNVNVDTITGGAVYGDILVIRLAPGSSNVIVRKGKGNVFRGPNRLLKEPTNTLILVSNGTAWDELDWQG